MGGWIELALLVIVIALAGTAAWASWSAAPFVPTATRDVERLLSLADVKAGDVVYDLGSGDGRLLFAAAKRGAIAVGYEISILPYIVSLIRRRFVRERKNVTIHFKNFFSADLSPATVVVAFLLPRSMAQLGPKFVTELRPGTRVVSYAFKIAGWEPTKKDKPDARTLAVWVYRTTEHQ